jgi:hypothetical protein
MPGSVSVIIPTLHEAGVIEFPLPRLLCPRRRFEIILADRASCASTLHILNQFPQVKKGASAKGRANQMNLFLIWIIKKK